MAEPKQVRESRFTYGDYVHWPEDERWELIDGVAYDMTPAPRSTRFHYRNPFPIERFAR